ncbi:granzyme A [Gracilinanus agilis]|uniref:granzyme A n=1 Tax=Gracilinanus agilis TaxID=191870 RepID=UPI001CFE4239|nr:granzyme A [Gracilinanus agilis]
MADSPGHEEPGLVRQTLKFEPCVRDGGMQLSRIQRTQGRLQRGGGGKQRLHTITEDRNCFDTGHLTERTFVLQEESLKASVRVLTQKCQDQAAVPRKQMSQRGNRNTAREREVLRRGKPSRPQNKLSQPTGGWRHPFGIQTREKTGQTFKSVTCEQGPSSRASVLKKTLSSRQVRANMDIPLLSFVSLLSGVTFLLLIPGDSCVDIIGGNEVFPHSRPYMALIHNKNDFCGGALIKENWVITAAHCNTKASSKVILGAHSSKKAEPEQQIKTIKQHIPYPCWVPSTHSGDLKLLQLTDKVKITKAVKTLKLPQNAKDIKPGTICKVAGWGQINNTKKTQSETLREVNVTVIDRKICNDKHHYNFDPVIGLDMICAGNLKGGKDSCNGDSGGPLICKDNFVGITSFGLPGKCGVPQGPGVYTRLTKEHLNWIKNTIKGVA